MKLSLLILGILSFNLFAEPVNSIVTQSKSLCPMPTEHHSKVLRDLQVLQENFDKRPECQLNSASIVDMRKLITSDERKRIFGYLKNDIQELTQEETDEVRDYTIKIAETTNNLISSIQNSSCKKSKEEGTLVTIATVIEETSTLVHSLKGPYGAPIQVGAAVFAGALRGISRIVENQGFKFNKIEHRRLYEKNLCIYDKISQGVLEILVPEIKTDALELLFNQTITKIDVLRRDCSDCMPLFNTLVIKDKLEREAKKLGQEVLRLEGGSGNRVYKCGAYAHLISSKEGPVQKMMNLIDNNLVEMAAHVDSYNQLQESLNIFDQQLPTIDKCINTDLEKVTGTNRIARGAMELYILYFNDFIDNNIRFHQKLANKAFEQKAGDYLLSTYSRVKWANREIKNNSIMSRPGSEMITMDIGMLKEDLDEFVYDKQTPKYLKQLLKSAKEKLSNYDKVFKKLDMQKRVNYSLEDALQDSDAFMEAIEALYDTDQNLVSNFYSELSRRLTPYYVAMNNFLNMQNYCNYFSKIGKIQDPILEVCTSEKAVSLKEDFDKRQLELVPLKKFLFWADRIFNQDVKWMYELADHYENWNKSQSPLTPATQN